MKRDSLRLNVIYNITGTVIPLGVTVITVPRYIAAVGVARFGVISLIWLVFGYFGLFDFGLSRATANRLAQLRNGDPRERAAVFYTALIMNSLLGLFAATIFYATALPLLDYFSHDAVSISAEMPEALPWTAFLIPLAMVGGVFIGSLEAEERFLTLNLQQIVGTILLQCLPLVAVSVFGPTIKVAVIGAVLARTVSVCWSGLAAFSSIIVTGRPSVRIDLGKSLLKYGGSVAITNSVALVLVSVDQFLIASMLGPNAVAHYSVPFNLAMKTLIIPSALTRALFPRLSALHRDAAGTMADKATLTLAWAMSLICAPCLLLAQSALTVWLGKDFTAFALPVAQLLLLGTWINGIAYVPYALIQGQGRPDIVAKFHAVELTIFIGLIWLGIRELGLPGAALAWSLRCALDAILLFWATGFKFGRAFVFLPPAFFVVGAWAVAVLVKPELWVAIALASLFVIFGFCSMILRDAALRTHLRSVAQLLKLRAKSRCHC